MDLSDVNNAAYLASSLCCIAAITALASQKTSRLGNVLGLTGVSSGLAVTLGMLQPNPDLLTQMLGCLLIGGSVGGFAASRIEVTSLPQMVALFHRLVGLNINFEFSSRLKHFSYHLKSSVNKNSS